MNTKDSGIFEKFESLRFEKGLSAENAFILAEKMQIDFFTRIRVMRKLYNLTLAEAKKIAIIAKGRAHNSYRDANEIMEEYQNNLLKTLESCFKTESL